MYGLSVGHVTFDLGCTEWPPNTKYLFLFICEIETSFVLLIYRKSCMGFPLVMWPLTSDAPNDPKTSNIYFSQKICEIDISFVLLIYRKSCTSDAPNDPKTPNIYFSQTICEIETSFVLLAYRKSCIGFPLMMSPLTSDAPNDPKTANIHFSQILSLQILSTLGF